ncbi:MAG: hypothetical protein EBV70_03775 [Actinobacteria bacterium]|nr:hypothetical protein [Actinomycetota bacterium]
MAQGAGQATAPPKPASNQAPPVSTFRPVGTQAQAGPAATPRPAPAPQPQPRPTQAAARPAGTTQAAGGGAVIPRALAQAGAPVTVGEPVRPRSENLPSTKVKSDAEVAAMASAEFKQAAYEYEGHKNSIRRLEAAISAAENSSGSSEFVKQRKINALRAQVIDLQKKMFAIEDKHPGIAGRIQTEKDIKQTGNALEKGQGVVFTPGKAGEPGAVMLLSPEQPKPQGITREQRDLAEQYNNAQRARDQVYAKMQQHKENAASAPNAEQWAQRKVALDAQMNAVEKQIRDIEAKFPGVKEFSTNPLSEKSVSEIKEQRKQERMQQENAAAIEQRAAIERQQRAQLN